MNKMSVDKGDATFSSQEELDFIINYDIKYRMDKAQRGGRVGINDKI